MPSPRIDWTYVTDHARDWVLAQEFLVSLRQVFYRLVSDQLIPNTTSAYKGLSRVTAERRRNGTFPAMSDATREIYQLPSWADHREFQQDSAKDFHLDRTEGQEHQVWVVVEKRGMFAQVNDWIGDRGWLVVPTGGYVSQTIADDVRHIVLGDMRPSVLLYLGDYDASGADIERDFLKRTGCWDIPKRVALTQDQVTDFSLPTNPGKEKDSRAKGFAASNGGDLTQVEIDALDPADLRGLLLTEGDAYWDEDAWASVVADEEAQRAEILASLR